VFVTAPDTADHFAEAKRFLITAGKALN
jgi:hypothetical protein